MRLLRHRTMLISGAITLAVVLAVVLGPAVSPYQPGDMDFLNVLSPPGWTHPMGTDSFGRDVLVRVMAGGRISLIISVLGVGTGAVLGAGFGMAASWCGGWVEGAIMAVADLLFAFPSFVLALFMMVVLGFGLQDVIFNRPSLRRATYPPLLHPPGTRPQHDRISAVQRAGQKRQEDYFCFIVPGQTAVEWLPQRKRSGPLGRKPSRMEPI